MREMIRLFGSLPVDIPSMRAWKFEPKPEAMTRMRHGETSDPAIVKNVGLE
jgi:hypothetical protein